MQGDHAGEKSNPSPTVAQRHTIAVEGDVTGSTLVVGTNVFFAQAATVMRPADAVIDPRSVFRRVNLDRFVGRRWVTDELDRFMASTPSGVFVIEAMAGMGKSALLANLVHARGYLSHFCELTPGADGVAAALRNIAAQLIGRYELPALLLDEVLPGLATRPDFLQRLLFDAALARDRISHGEPIVLVIDALDEAGTPNRQNVLGLPSVLPDNVYIVASMRPVPVFWACNVPRRVFQLDNSDPRNQADIVEYVRCASSHPSTKASLDALQVSCEAFVERMLSISRGVWIYLYYVVAEIEAGLKTPLDLDGLPNGIWQYYGQHWASWRDANLDEWRTLALPLLGLLASAREDVSVAQILAMWPAPLVADEYSVTRLLETTWAPFVIASGSVSGEAAKYRLYHASLREFLNGSYPHDELTTGERAIARELLNATREANERIARLFLALFSIEAHAGREQDEQARENLRDAGLYLYGINHLIGHILNSARPKRVGTVLRMQRRVVVERPFAGSYPADHLELPWFSAQATLSEPVWFAENAAIGNTEGFAANVGEWVVSLAKRRRETGGTPTRDELFGRYLLASFKQRADNLPVGVVCALCEKGIWTTKRALAEARLGLDLLRRRDILVSIAPFLGDDSQNWLFARDLARSLDAADMRIQACCALMAHAGAAQREAIAKELEGYLGLPSASARDKSTALARLSLLELAHGNLRNSIEKLRAVSVLSVALDLFERQAIEAPVDWWVSVLEAVEYPSECERVLRIAGTAVAQDERVVAAGRGWLGSGRPLLALVVGTVAANTDLVCDSLCEIGISRVRVRGRQLPAAFAGLDTLAGNPLGSTVCHWLVACVAEESEGKVSEAVLTAAVQLRHVSVRAQVRDAVDELNADRTSPFMTVFHWLLEPSVFAGGSDYVGAVVSSWSEPWRAYMLRLLVRHGANPEACFAVAQTINDPLYRAEAFSDVFCHVDHAMRRDALAVLLPQFRNRSLRETEIVSIGEWLGRWIEPADADFLLGLIPERLVELRIRMEIAFITLLPRSQIVNWRRESGYASLVEIAPLLNALSTARPELAEELVKLRLGQGARIRTDELDIAARTLASRDDVVKLLDASPFLHGESFDFSGRDIIVRHIARGMLAAVLSPRKCPRLEDSVKRLRSFVSRVATLVSSIRVEELLLEQSDEESLDSLLGVLPDSLLRSRQTMQCLVALGETGLLQAAHATKLFEKVDSVCGEDESESWVRLLFDRDGKLCDENVGRRFVRYIDESSLVALIGRVPHLDAKSIETVARRMAATSSHSTRWALLRFLEYHVVDEQYATAFELFRRWHNEGARSWLDVLESDGYVLTEPVLCFIANFMDAETFEAVLDRASRWCVDERTFQILSWLDVEHVGYVKSQPDVHPAFGLDEYSHIGRSEWLRWTLENIPNHLVPVALARGAAALARACAGNRCRSIEEELIGLVYQESTGFYKAVTETVDANARTFAGLGMFSLVEQSALALHAASTRLSLDELGSISCMTEHVERVESETMLRLIITARIAVAEEQKDREDAKIDESRFASRLSRISLDMWEWLLKSMADHLISRNDSPLASAFAEWCSHAPTDVMIEGLILTLGIRDAPVRAKASVIILRAMRGGNSRAEWNRAVFTRIADRMRWGIEADLVSRWFAAPMTRTNSLIEGAERLFVNIPERRRAPFGYLALELDGVAFAREIVKCATLGDSVPDGLLASAIRLSPQSIESVFALSSKWADDGGRKRLFIDILGAPAADNPQQAILLLEEAEDSPAKRDFAFAVLALYANSGVERWHEAAQAALCCLVDCMGVSSRSQIDAMLEALAPLFAAAYGVDEMADILTDLVHCRLWWHAA
ncbi:ATP-binding protein [Burkholderia sp. 22088]|uniref:ATP-binding protein n=1 Tax=Burkholderia sp. 22088 TaxID=3453871 RepID=UPI003F849B0E